MQNATTAIPAPLQTLYDAAANIGMQFEMSPEAVLDYCGLLLEIPPQRNYIDWCTPRNVLTFATTGGDSVHYSYLVDERLPEGVCPIVMTLPCVYDTLTGPDGQSVTKALSWVIAESFQEFFDYGYYVGWFSLEQMYYDEQEGPAYFLQPSEDFGDIGTQQLPLLHRALNMKPVPPTLERFAQLQQKYGALLDIPPMPVD
ncbi:hypothetical protein DZC30_18540 [Comamonas testosteroni]|uniref:Uncharacterized protein n=1 Tax=Comamonas testosteroni TaxID=285 RepID=A0A373FD72_COMTE|nr:hypothetical protein [Comamonas testosteroni]RGE41425.1 hypothetical protein DZC30_18540 [Comamonas testosteroni]